MMRIIENLLKKQGWYKEVVPFLVLLIWETLMWGMIYLQTAGGKILTYKNYVKDDHIYYRSILLDMKIQLLVVTGTFLLIQFGMIYWSYKKQYGWGKILIPVFVLMQMGLMIQIVSGTGFLKHAMMLAVGIVVMLLFSVLSCAEPGGRGIKAVLAVIVLLCLANLFLSRTINGSKAWIILPVIHLSIQPGEFFKVLDIILVSVGYERIRNNSDVRRDCILVWIIEILVLLMVHDIGNALILLLLGFFCALAFNLWDTLLFSICIAVAGSAGLIGLSVVSEKVFKKLSYIGDRFSIINTVLMDSEAEKNFRTMLLAVMRAGVRGTGLADGDYTYHMNIMASDSDYVILSVAAIFGIAGVLVIVTALILLVKNADQGQAVLTSGQYLSGKLCCIALVLHATVNIAAATNIGPLTGTTLPFVSAGGSSILANCMLIGILLGNCYPPLRRRFWARRWHRFTDRKVNAIADKGTIVNDALKDTARMGLNALIESVKIDENDDEEEY